MTIILGCLWAKHYVHTHSPRVTTLYLDGIFYSMPSIQSLPGPVSTCAPLPDLFSILLEDAVEVVNLCRPTLNHLKLWFLESVGFPPVMLDAIHNVTALKALSIQGPTCEHIKHDFQSVKTLLEGIPLLKSLSIQFPSLPKMRLSIGSLPRLSHFWIATHRRNRHAAIEICREAERPIECLEMFSDERASTATGIASGLTNTLKTLFILSVPDRVPRDLRRQIFPNLRVLRGEYCNPPSWGLSWLEWPVFQTIEVFITTYWHGSDYWQTMFELNAFSSITVPAHLKHIVFTTSESHKPTDASLVISFAALGIQCHFMDRLTHGQIMVCSSQSFDSYSVQN